MPKPPVSAPRFTPENHPGFAQAAQLAALYQARLPTGAELQQLAQSYGLEMATQVFYTAVVRLPNQQPWLAEINRWPAAAGPGDAGAQLLIVPALFYRERPEFGGDGAALAEVARACGLQVTIAPVKSRGSLAANAEIVWQQIAATRTPFWIASLSKGSGEVRLALAAHAKDRALANLRGWLNISGLVRGTPLAERYAMGLRAFFLLAGVEVQAADELRADHPFWRAPFDLPHQLQIINVVGVPTRGQITQRNMRWRYNRLADWGPNDGMAPLNDLLVQPGWIYPLWGADHFLQTAQVRPVFQRLCRYMRQQSR